MRCFCLDEGDTRTTLVLDGAGEGAGLTVFEHKDGVEVAPPVGIPGTLLAEGFQYPDGTLVRIEGDRLISPTNSLLAGLDFVEGEAPKQRDGGPDDGLERRLRVDATRPTLRPLP